MSFVKLLWHGLGHNGPVTKSDSFCHIKLCTFFPTLSRENRNRWSFQNVVFFYDYERTKRARKISVPANNIRRTEPSRISSVNSSTCGDTLREECWPKLSKYQRQSITFTCGIRNLVPVIQGGGYRKSESVSLLHRYLWSVETTESDCAFTDSTISKALKLFLWSKLILPIDSLKYCSDKREAASLFTKLLFSQILIFSSWLDSPIGPTFPLSGFSITPAWHTTLGRTPPDEWSARRRNLYRTTHNTHNRHSRDRRNSNPQYQQTSGRRPKL